MERVVIPPYDEYELSTYAIADGTVYTGHIGGAVDEDGAVLTDVEGQMHRTLDNLAAALDRVDLDLSDLATLTVILADIEDFHAMHEVWTDRFEEGQYPARTVITSEFVSEDILVQVEGIAAL